MKARVVAAIFARGGSKGVPRKNIRLLAGKPLIAYAIETASASALVDRVVVSTDDAEIAEVARHYGAEVPFLRPASLAADDSPEWLSWQHAVRAVSESDRSPDVFVCVPPTSPLRAVEDIDRCIALLTETDADIVITVKSAARSPYFNMVTVDADRTARLVMAPEQAIYRRQDVPRVYDMTTVAYAARPAFVLRATSLFEGVVKAVEVPDERALDIDTETDFSFAEFLLNRRRENA